MYHVLDVDWLKLSPITAWAWKYRQLRCGQDASRMQLYRMRPGCIPTKCTCHNTIICASRALRNLKIFASRHASWQLLMPPQRRKLKQFLSSRFSQVDVKRQFLCTHPCTRVRKLKKMGAKPKVGALHPFDPPCVRLCTLPLPNKLHLQRSPHISGILDFVISSRGGSK